MIVLPGGMPGTLHLKAHEGLADLIRKADKEGKLLAAICAAPTIYGEMGLLEGKNATCYPGMEDKLLGANWRGAAGRCRRKLRDKPGRWNSDCICTHIGYNPEG